MSDLYDQRIDEMKAREAVDSAYYGTSQKAQDSRNIERLAAYVDKCVGPQPGFGGRVLDAKKKPSPAELGRAKVITGDE